MFAVTILITVIILVIDIKAKKKKSKFLEQNGIIDEIPTGIGSGAIYNTQDYDWVLVDIV